MGCRRGRARFGFSVSERLASANLSSGNNLACALDTNLWRHLAGWGYPFDLLLDTPAEIGERFFRLILAMLEHLAERGRAGLG